MSQLENISLRQLSIFRSIVEAGNLAKASEKIGLTSPAISTALKTLETQIDAKTMRRGRDGKIQLSSVGEEIYRLAQRIDAAIDLTSTTIKSLKEGYRDYVRLGVVSTAKYFAPGIVRALQKHTPDIELDLFIGNRGEILSALETQQIYMAITGRTPRQPKVHYSPIGAHPHILIAAPGMRWDGDIAGLSRYDFLVREDDSGTRILFERFIAELPELPKIKRKAFNSNETIKQAVMAELGIAFISASTCEFELSSGRVQSLPLPQLPIKREWYLVRSATSELDSATAQVHDYILYNKEKLVPKFDL